MGGRGDWTVSMISVAWMDLAGSSATTTSQSSIQPWEARVFVLAELLTAGGLIPSGDAFRHGVERIDTVAYLTHGYYGRWLAAIEGVLGRAGCRAEG